MTMSDFEKRLAIHADITKSAMRSPFDTERKMFIMTEKKHKITKIAIISAAAVCLIASTVFAAHRLLGAGDAANSLGDSKLAQYFEGNRASSATVTDSHYKATVLGIASGENLSDFASSSWELFPERTYAVVAIEKADGSEMTFDDNILVTPLIRGLNPFLYNIFTMNGGYTSDIIDGILYRIIECDAIECFADRDVYMAIVSESFLNNNAFAFDEATGEISPKEDYDGTNILIKLNLDKSKADRKKAEEYLNKMREAHLSPDSDSDACEPEGDSEEITLTESGDFYIESTENDGEHTLTVTEK